MPAISIGRLRGGYCVYWDDEATGKRKRYQLAARTRAEAEAESRDRYLKETAAPSGATVTQIWAAYIVHLGSKPTAKTMAHTGKAVLAHFGAFRPDQITVADCRDYMAQRMAAGRKVGSVHTELGHLRSALRWAAKVRLTRRALTTHAAAAKWAPLAQSAPPYSPARVARTAAALLKPPGRHR